MFDPQSKKLSARKLVSITVSIALYILMLPTASSGPQVSAQAPGNNTPASIPVIPPGAAYRLTTLISDVPGLAPVLDPLMVNPRGITVRGTTPFWIVNEGTSTVQLVSGDAGGAPVVLTSPPGTENVTIPGSLPTGIVANLTSDFQIPPPGGGPPSASIFIFSSLTGNITAWNTTSGAAAQNVRSKPGHTYTGLAIGTATVGHRLYAADNDGTIDVFDETFADSSVPGGFVDPTIPSDYHPFNIQNIGGSLYVTYVKPQGTAPFVVTGVGEGFVRKFSTDGVRDPGFAIDNGALNAPWGVAIAPASFGLFGAALLVGNFGEGGGTSINAFNQFTAAFLGPIQDESGNGIEIDQLWGLQFGNGGLGGDVNTLYFTAGIGDEQHGLFGKLNPTTAFATSLIQFADDEPVINEGAGHIDITIARLGDASGSATVNYNTFDESSSGHASQKSDYEIALGSVTFAPGETSKTFRILIVNDTFVEGDEVIDLMLSNPTGAGLGTGSPNTAELTILDNDAVAPTTNPIDDATFFVRQHYLDFLGREPDPAGLAFWVNQITSCGANPACIAAKRVHVSAAFFLSLEFQQSGYAAYLTHRAAFGPTAPGSPLPVYYGNFMRDQQAINRGVIFGAPGADAQLEANKQAFYNEFVTRPEFVAKYPATQTNEEYVDALLASADLTPSEVRLFVVNLTNDQENPPAVPTASGGGARPASFGTARLQFNEAQTELTLTSTVNNLDFSGSQTPGDTNDNLTVAHIHAGPAVTPATNGPVVWGFFGSPFNDNTPNDQQVIPFTTGVGGSINGKWDAPEGNGTTLAAQLSNLREGRAYLNFHSSQFPGGEVRGNLPAASASRDALVAGLNGATETRATVLRKVSEAEELRTREFNMAFVAMEYFGYLRRDPDTAGYNFWLNKLNSFNGDFIKAEMVKAFIASLEYRQRFGPS